MKTIAIIGANGRNAATWTTRFLRAGYSVRALVRNAERRPETLGVVWTEFELDNAKTYRKALSGADVFALITPAEPSQTERELVLIDAAGNEGVSRVLNVSVLGADLPVPISPFARWQAAVEVALRRSGIAHVTLRPNAYMQSILLQRSGIEAGFYVEPSAEARTSVIDVADIAAAAVVVAQGSHDGEAIDLTGPSALTGQEIAAELSRATGSPIAFLSPSLSAFRQGLLDRGAPPWRAGALCELYQAILEGQAPHMAEVSAATDQLLGRRGKSLAEFLTEAFRPGETPFIA